MAFVASTPSFVSRCVAALLAVTSAVGAYHLTTPALLASHDEGVYVATAWALETSQGYRLINLPSALPQTKYPPGYPAALAIAGSPAPGATGDFRPVKRVNAVCLAVIVFLTGELAARLSGAAMARVIAALLASSALGLTSFVDIVGSDLLYMAWLMLAIVSLPATNRAEARKSWITGAALAASILTRTAGVAPAVGAMAFLWRRNRRNALSVAIAVAMAVTGWITWTALARAPGAGVLERYYISYDNLAWTKVLAAPTYVLSVIAANTVSYVRTIPEVFGAPGTVLTLTLLLGLMLGARSCLASPLLSALAFLMVPYYVQLLGFEALVARYLLVGVPLACAVVGTATTRFSGAASEVRTTTAWACVALLLVANALELRHYASLDADAIHVGFGRVLPFRKSGFLETARWIREHTAQDAVLASANDTMYFAYTGRRGVRPWPYEPAQYDPHYHATSAAALSDQVPQDLRRLGVTYLVIDPMLTDLEGQHAASYMKLIQATGADTWTGVFTSDDGLHEVLRREPRQLPAP
jgi:hypothetical protein